jgi:hypothetical protein
MLLYGMADPHPAPPEPGAASHGQPGPQPAAGMKLGKGAVLREENDGVMARVAAGIEACPRPGQDAATRG